MIDVDTQFYFTAHKTFKWTHIHSEPTRWQGPHLARRYKEANDLWYLPGAWIWRRRQNRNHHHYWGSEMLVVGAKDSWQKRGWSNELWGRKKHLHSRYLILPSACYKDWEEDLIRLDNIHLYFNYVLCAFIFTTLSLHMISSLVLYICLNFNTTPSIFTFIISRTLTPRADHSPKGLPLLSRWDIHLTTFLFTLISYHPTFCLPQCLSSFLTSKRNQVHHFLAPLYLLSQIFRNHGSGCVLNDCLKPPGAEAQ